MQPNRSIVIIAVFIALIVGCFYLYENRVAVYAQMNAWDLLPKNEAMTELYFSDYAKLPKQTLEQY
jgi:hypothetical protein